MEENKTENKKNLIIPIILVIICFIGGYFLGTLYSNGDVKESNKPVKENYDNYINKELFNENNSDSFLIKSIKDDKISFVAWHGREYENIPFNDGKAVFNPFENTEATIELKDNKIFVKTKPISEEADDISTKDVYFKDLNAITDPGEKEINVLLGFLNENIKICKNSEPSERSIQLQDLRYSYPNDAVQDSELDFMEYISARFYSCYHDVEYVDVLDYAWGGHLLMTPSQYSDYQKYFNYTLKKYDDDIAEDDYYKDGDNIFYKETIPYLNQDYYVAATHGDGYGTDLTKSEILSIKKNDNEYEVEVKITITDEAQSDIINGEIVEIKPETTREFKGTFTAELVGDYLKYSPLYFTEIN